MIADTSCLVSFYLKDDSNHDLAVKAIRRHESAITIPDYVIAETATLLLYKRDLKTSKAFIEAVENTQSIQILHTSISDFRGILETYKSQKKQISFVDAAVIYHASRLRLGVLTFDKNMKKELGETA